VSSIGGVIWRGKCSTLCSTTLQKDTESIDVLSDAASRLNTERRGLLKLFNYIVNRQIDVVVVTYKDRLARFGFEHLEYFFKQIGVNC